ncbi:MAG: hypothetical protein WAU65_03210 [Candidatus Nanoarchaeia archaeon]
MEKSRKYESLEDFERALELDLEFLRSGILLEDRRYSSPAERVRNQRQREFEGSAASIRDFGENYLLEHAARVYD